MKWLKPAARMKVMRKVHTELILGDNMGVRDVDRKILLKKNLGL
jgi:hypothetical protein